MRDAPAQGGSGDSTSRATLIDRRDGGVIDGDGPFVARAARFMGRAVPFRDGATTFIEGVVPVLADAATFMGGAATFVGGAVPVLAGAARLEGGRGAYFLRFEAPQARSRTQVADVEDLVTGSARAASLDPAPQGAEWAIPLAEASAVGDTRIRAG